MGYLIKNEGEIQKFTTFIERGDMANLSSSPYLLNPPVKPGFQFSIISAFIQCQGILGYTNYTYLWIWQRGGLNKTCSMVKTLGNNLAPGFTNGFTMNVDVNGAIKYGSMLSYTREYYLEMNIDDSSGDCAGLVTLYGVFLPNI